MKRIHYIMFFISLLPVLWIFGRFALSFYFESNYIPVKATILQVDTMAGNGIGIGVEYKYQYTTRSGKTYTNTEFSNWSDFKAYPRKGQVMEAGYMPFFNSYSRVFTYYELNHKRKQ